MQQILILKEPLGAIKGPSDLFSKIKKIDVDYTQLIENTDETKIQETIACGGGACEINI